MTALAALAFALVPQVELPAPLAWLVDQNDHPLVSRRVVLLEPGAAEPRTVLEPVLRCFDAADLQDLAWAGQRLVVNGPVSQRRTAPNVAMPIQLVDLDGQREPFDVTPESFEPTADGRKLLCASFQRLALLDFESGAQRTLVDAAWLGRAQMHSAALSADESAVYAVLEHGRDKRASGLWRFPLTDAEPQHVDERVARVRAVGASGTIWMTDRVKQSKYTPHELLRRTTETRVVAADLHWNQSFAERPGQAEVAYVRCEDGAIVLRALAGDAEPRVLWDGTQEADALTFSSDGKWLAFDTRDEQFASHVYVIELATGAVQHLGPGLRPAWGPAR